MSTKIKCLHISLCRMLIDSLYRVVFYSPDHSKIYHFAPNTYQEDGNLDEGNAKSFISTE